MNYPNLRNAPIVEGLIQFQVRPNQATNIESVRAFAEKLSDRYKIVGELRDIRAQLVFSREATTPQPIPNTHVGFRLERDNPRFVLHARVGELLISRLKPYDRWDELLAEARLLWNKYAEMCKPEMVTRLATRFVNQLDLPVSGLDLKDYFLAPIQIPQKLPQAFEQFLTRVVIPDEETGAHIAISQASGPPNLEAESLPIVLDIDVYKADLELELASEKIWELLGKMRDIKNRAFFGSLTEKSIKLFS